MTSRLHLYSMTFFLAACSILYELLLAQTISSLLSQSVIWYSLTIGFYLGAMGLGALSIEKLHSEKQDWQTLFHVEIFLSVLGAASVMIIYLAHIVLGYAWLRNDLFNGLGFFLAIFFLLVILIGFLTGLELPLFIRLDSGLFHYNSSISLKNIVGSLKFGKFQSQRLTKECHTHTI